MGVNGGVELFQEGFFGEADAEGVVFASGGSRGLDSGSGGIGDRGGITGVMTFDYICAGYQHLHWNILRRLSISADRRLVLPLRHCGLSPPRYPGSLRMR